MIINMIITTIINMTINMIIKMIIKMMINMIIDMIIDMIIISIWSSTWSSTRSSTWSWYQYDHRHDHDHQYDDQYDHQYDDQGVLADRAAMTADEDRAFLTFSPVMPRCASDYDDDVDVNFVLFSDDGDYKCEITYLDINRSCPVVQVIFSRSPTQLVSIFGFYLSTDKYKIHRGQSATWLFGTCIWKIWYIYM